MMWPNIGLPTGLRGRLLLAFGEISIFAVLAAMAGFAALVFIRHTLEDTTGRRVPEAIGAMELLGNTDRLVAVGPALSSTANADEVSLLSARKNADSPQSTVSCAPCDRRTAIRRC